MYSISEKKHHKRTYSNVNFKME